MDHRGPEQMNPAAEPFYTYHRYLHERYGTTVYRVAVDAGFSCPHRGTDRRNPGCSYCDEAGSRAPYLGDLAKLEEQIQGALVFLRKRYRANQFTLYFQAFSNTFAPVNDLKRIYDSGLAQADFRELIVSTRPDCIDRSKAALLASYKTPMRDVWVELGLQSMHDETLKRINRGHTVADFLAAYETLKAEKLNVCVHLIFGLPGEGMREIVETVEKLGALRPDGVKIHNLHVVKGTLLAAQYEKGEIGIPGYSEHLENVIAALELLPADTVIMRLVCDTVPARLIAPVSFPPKQQFIELVKTEMRKRGTFQGNKCTLLLDQ